MKNRNKQTMKLEDLVRVVSQYTRNDQETGLVVADLINRGTIRLHGRYRRCKVVAS